MYKLTERRLAKAKDILDKFAAVLSRRHRIDCLEFETQLKECWNMGYREIKDLMRQLIVMSSYRLLAGYYMQHSNDTRIVSGFNGPLCDLYGVKKTSGAPDEETAKKFWSTAFEKPVTST